VKLSEVFKVADSIAPKSLSDTFCATFGAYDNSGILVDVGEEIIGVLFTLDLTDAAIKKALETGANLIITHHPMIYGKIGTVRDEGEGTLGKKLVQCIRNGISVISMHLNLDTAPGGIDESLMKGICLSAETEGVGTRLTENVTYMSVFDGGAYGRAYDIPKTMLGALKTNMEKVFSTQRIMIYGDEEKEITRVASFCGAGADEGAVAFAKRNGADVMVSSDFKHHILTMAFESGMGVIVLTHYASEQYGFRKYYEKIRRQVEIPCVYHTDDILF
jgi:dinuclear metal center YbgI/SA1388 family protein